MLGLLSAFAFIAALVLIVLAGGLVARADWTVAPRGRGGMKRIEVEARLDQLDREGK